MNTPLKIKLCLVALDNEYISIGLRKMAAIARKAYPDCDFLNIIPKNIRSKEDLRLIAERIAIANVACFSLMTAHAETAKDIIAAAKALNPNLFIVGDEKQAIYRFQGASLENFLYFQKKYKGARVIELVENYRSTQTILDAAYSIMFGGDTES